MIADPLQIRHHLKGCGNCTKIPGHRRLPGKQAQPLGLDVPLHIFNGPVMTDVPPHLVSILFFQSRKQAVISVLYPFRHLEHILAQFLQLLFK